MEESGEDHLSVTRHNAAALEKEGHLHEAARMYEQLLKSAPFSIYILNKLMIVNRRMKAYKKEVFFIDKAIAIHESKYRVEKPKDVKVERISKQLNSLLGHTNKKGQNLLVIPEVERLQKRKATALKKLKN
ncbi:MAG: hypothetical protein JWR61_4499 [Ferruginibacter sp.]|uniref:hypothetical protein n=1 Tax=Ferruginibacter sp. TaxID=1940288 RepID=UPI002657CE52|nr:hypothetical protein [Ferruginibacter sp.]MDB5279544.1 hypothetical protein [Ferruginibacter sp.]